MAPSFQPRKIDFRTKRVQVKKPKQITKSKQQNKATTTTTTCPKVTLPATTITSLEAYLISAANSGALINPSSYQAITCKKIFEEAPNLLVPPPAELGNGYIKTQAILQAECAVAKWFYKNANKFSGSTTKYESALLDFEAGFISAINGAKLQPRINGVLTAGILGNNEGVKFFNLYNKNFCEASASSV